MIDDKGNLIAVTLFESYLSHYLIKNSHHFEAVYQKILLLLQEIEELNKNNSSFDRIMFNINSLLEQQYQYNSIEQLRKNFNLFAANYFIKLFCEYIVHNPKLTLVLPAASLGVNTSSSSCSATLFQPDVKERAQISTYLRTPNLFQPENRGVVDADIDEVDDVIATRKFGITTIEHTPDNLITYFDKAHEPSQFFYIPSRTSNVGKWFAFHNLPIISGTSGSACDLLMLVSSLLSLFRDEVQLLMIACAATLVAKGHHSYFEIMILLEKCGFKFESTQTLFEFYEQTLPKSITSNDSYLQFKRAPEGKILLEGITDDLNFNADCIDLPSVSIGNLTFNTNDAVLLSNTQGEESITIPRM